MCIRDSAAGAHQHPSGGGIHQGVLWLLAAVPVHGSEQPAGRADAQLSLIHIFREALALGLALSEKSGADLMLATDPDADRVGIAVRCKDGSYQPVSYTHLDVYKRQALL